MRIPNALCLSTAGCAANAMMSMGYPVRSSKEDTSRGRREADTPDTVIANTSPIVSNHSSSVSVLSSEMSRKIRSYYDRHFFPGPSEPQNPFHWTSVRHRYNLKTHPDGSITGTRQFANSTLFLFRLVMVLVGDSYFTATRILTARDKKYICMNRDGRVHVTARGNAGCNWEEQENPHTAHLSFYNLRYPVDLHALNSCQRRTLWCSRGSGRRSCRRPRRGVTPRRLWYLGVTSRGRLKRFRVRPGRGCRSKSILFLKAWSDDFSTVPAIASRPSDGVRTPARTSQTRVPVNKLRQRYNNLHKSSSSSSDRKDNRMAAIPPPDEKPRPHVDSDPQPVLPVTKSDRDIFLESVRRHGQSRTKDTHRHRRPGDTGSTDGNNNPTNSRNSRRKNSSSSNRVRSSQTQIAFTHRRRLRHRTSHRRRQNRVRVTSKPQKGLLGRIYNRGG